VDPPRGELAGVIAGDRYDVEPRRTPGLPGFAQVASRDRRQPLALGPGNGLYGLAVGAGPPRLDLDEYEGAAVKRDKIDLPSPTSESARDDREAGIAQKSLREALTRTAELVRQRLVGAI